MYQKLLTKEVEALFEKYPYRSQEKVPNMEKKVLVKFFNPWGAGTWIICEAEKEGDDWCLWGYCSLGYGYEFGPVMLSELTEYQGPAGLRIERDMYLKKDCKVGDLIKESDLM